jgi:hypothetical protein
MRDSGEKSVGCFGYLVNLIAAVVVMVALLVGAILTLLIVSPQTLSNTPFGSLLNVDEANLPTAVPLAALPAPTETHTPTPVLAPTWTPIVPEPSQTPQPTNTRRPTLEPSITPTFPSKTPTHTPTATPTNTPLPTPLGPTATPSATRASFPFTKSDASPFYLQNSANSAGCDWLGIAGEVLDLSRVPVPVGSYRVHVWGSGIDERVVVGGAPAYSPSGWEQFLFNAPTVREYNVQLETPSGTAVSQVYTIQTRASCSQNLVRLDFLQNH